MFGFVAHDWIDAAGALGSAFAAGVAVYVGVVQPWRRKPSLSVGQPIRDRELVIAGAKGKNGELEDTAWIRLSVSAASKREAAEDVEISVLAVCEASHRGVRDHEPPGIAGMSLPVSTSKPGTQRVHVPAGASRMFDLAKVWRSHAVDCHAKLEIETAFKAPDARNEITSGEIELDLAVTARNARARSYRVVIAYDGSWGPNKASIWEHLRVKPVEPSRVGETVGVTPAGEPAAS